MMMETIFLIMRISKTKSMFIGFDHDMCLSPSPFFQLIKFSPNSAQCCLPSLVPAEFVICGMNLTVDGKVSGNEQ